MNFYHSLLADFKGCFKVHGYLSSNESEVWRDVSIRSCMILCHERNYRYATLHNGSQCACLNEPEYLQLERLPKEACNIRCAISDEEFCGGRAAASVFWAVGSLILAADERAAELSGKRCRIYFVKTLLCSLGFHYFQSLFRREKAHREVAGGLIEKGSLQCNVIENVQLGVHF